MICASAALASAVLAEAPVLAQAPDTTKPPGTLRTDEVSRFLGETNAVFGKVAQVTFTPAFTFLNLEERTPGTAFAGVIPAGKTNLFAGLDRLTGRTVVITGKITEYNRTPQIIIESANQLRLADEPVLQPGVWAARLDAMEKEFWSLLTRSTPASRPDGDNRLVDAPARAAETGWIAAAWCITGALAVIAALLAWRVVRPRPKRSVAHRPLPAPAVPALLPATSEVQANPAPAAPLRLLSMGALSEAEAQAQRDRVVSELTEYAKERLVQGLYSQRKDLAETQQKAQQALAELEARLTALHLPMQQRIAAYEERIAQLQKELETRDGEMRELIQATVLLVRERLEETKERDASRFFDS